jgi:hypothetical protein
MADYSKITFSDEDYKKAAEKWQKELLLMPLLSCQDILQHMTGLPGIRGKYHFGTAEADAQFAPYDPHRKSTSTVDVQFRDIETFFGNMVQDFIPDDYVMTLLGQTAAVLGDGQKQAPSAKLVIACVMKALGYNLRQSLFTAKRNASGDKTTDLFDGWMTIIENEITAGNLSFAKGNYMLMQDTITAANAVDLLKSLDRALDPQLRARQKFIYCAPEVADAYNDNYLLTHSGISYNTKFEQPVIEGSMGKTQLLPLDVLAGCSKMIVTTKDNMLYGYDSMGDVERLQIDRFAPFVLTLSAAMFFGTQIRSLDKRFCTVVELAK